MAELDQVFKVVSNKFKFDDLNVHQKDAITSILKKKVDVFVSLPTGYGKSVIYQALPFAFDEYTRKPGHIVVVISPLVALIEDQIQNLQMVGITAISLSHIKTSEKIQQVEIGSFPIVYTTPEGLLKSERWRHMLSNEVYSEKLCGIAVDEAHVIKHWYEFSMFVKIRKINCNTVKFHCLQSNFQKLINN